MKEKCKNCTKPSKACVAYLMTISTRETLEWCRMWKVRFGWSNAVMAEKSNVPIGTINRIFSQAKTEDDAAGVKLATIRPIICALTGCTLEELESCEGQADLLATHTDDRKKIDYLKEQIKFKEDQMKAKDKQLEERYEYIMMSEKRKNRIIAILAISLAVSLLTIIAALVIDRMDPSKGFLWIDKMSAVFGNQTNTADNVLTNILSYKI